jgi:hypothetical protein
MSRQKVFALAVPLACFVAFVCFLAVFEAFFSLEVSDAFLDLSCRFAGTVFLFARESLCKSRCHRIFVMLTNTGEAERSASMLDRRILPNSPPLRASVGDSAPLGLRFRRAFGPLGMACGVGVSCYVCFLIRLERALFTKHPML